MIQTLSGQCGQLFWYQEFIGFMNDSKAHQWVACERIGGEIDAAVECNSSTIDMRSDERSEERLSVVLYYI